MGTFIDTPFDTPFTDNSTDMSEESNAFLNGALISTLPENAPPDTTFSVSISKDRKRLSHWGSLESAVFVCSVLAFFTFFFFVLTFWVGCSLTVSLTVGFLSHEHIETAAAMSTAIFKILNIYI